MVKYIIRNLRSLPIDLLDQPVYLRVPSPYTTVRTTEELAAERRKQENGNKQPRAKQSCPESEAGRT